MEPPLYSWQRGEPVSNGRGFFWEAAEVIVPAGAVKASDRMYVVRSPAGDVGKFIANEGTAKFPAHGKERTLSDFEFLVLASGAEAVWLLGVPSLDDCVWASERMVVIRATDHPDRDPGKFIADETAAKIPRGGREVTLRPEDFELLTVRRAGQLRGTTPPSPPPGYSTSPPSRGFFGSLFGGDSHGGGAGAASGATAAGGTGAAGAGVAGAMGAAGAAAHALAERGEKLSNLEDATQQMSLEAESFASMAAQLKEREQNRGLFPWS